MDSTALNHYVKSVIWNVDSAHIAECLSKGVDMGDRTLKDNEGWLRIGRYAAGKESAWVQAHKLRAKWANLETQVRGTPDNEWQAEVWARVRETNG